MIFLLIFYIITLYSDSANSEYLRFKHVHIEFGENIGFHVEYKIRKHLSNVSDCTVHKHFVAEDNHQDGNILWILFGDTKRRREFLPSVHDSLQNLPPESFQIAFSNISDVHTPNTFMLAGDGLPLDPTRHTNVSFDKNDIHYGAV